MRRYQPNQLVDRRPDPPGFAGNGKSHCYYLLFLKARLKQWKWQFKEWLTATKYWVNSGCHCVINFISNKHENVLARMHCIVLVIESDLKISSAVTPNKLKSRRCLTYLFILWPTPIAMPQTPKAECRLADSGESALSDGWKQVRSWTLL